MTDPAGTLVAIIGIIILGGVVLAILLGFGALGYMAVTSLADDLRDRKSRGKWPW